MIHFLFPMVCFDTWRLVDGAKIFSLRAAFMFPTIEFYWIAKCKCFTMYLFVYLFRTSLKTRFLASDSDPNKKTGNIFMYERELVKRRRRGCNREGFYELRDPAGSDLRRKIAMVAIKLSCIKFLQFRAIFRHF